MQGSEETSQTPDQSKNNLQTQNGNLPGITQPGSQCVSIVSKIDTETEPVNKPDVRLLKVLERQNDGATRLLGIFHEGKDTPSDMLIMRSINKLARQKMNQSLCSSANRRIRNGLARLNDELCIRESLKPNPGLVQLLGIRDSAQFVHLFERYYDLGPLYETENGLSFCRSEKSMKFREIVTEYFKDKLPVKAFESLNDQMYSEAEAGYIFWRLFNALNSLQNKQLCHLDIRPDRVFLSSDGTVVLGGLDCIVSMEHDEDGGAIDMFPGAFSFLAPECTSGTLYSAYSADLWAMSVMLYLSVSGSLPFPSENLVIVLDSIRDFKGPSALPHVSSELNSLLGRLLCANCSDRPNLMSVLNDPWFRKFGFYFTPIANETFVPVDHANPNGDWTSEDCVFEPWILNTSVCRVFKGLRLETPSPKNSLNITGDQASIPLLTSYGVSVEQLDDVSSTSQVNYSMENDVKEPLLGTNTRFGSSGPSPFSNSSQLPKEGTLKFTLRNPYKCCPLWKNKSVYVEKGRIGVGKPNQYVYHTLKDCYILQSVDDMSFEIRLSDAKSLFFRATDLESKKVWLTAIGYARDLAKDQIQSAE